jgi:hypothetical protein
MFIDKGETADFEIEVSAISFWSSAAAAAVS